MSEYVPFPRINAESEGSLVDELNEESKQRWQRLATEGKTQSARDVAAGILKRHEEAVERKRRTAHAG